MYKSLAYQLFAFPVPYKIRNWVSICEPYSESKLYFFYTSQLDTTPYPSNSTKHDLDTYDWAHSQAHKYSIVVFNKGAHYAGYRNGQGQGQASKWESYMADTRTSLDFLRDRFEDKILVFRTSPQGHPRCNSSSIPITASAAPQDISMGSSKWVGCPASVCHDWRFYPQRNAHILKEIRQKMSS